MVIIPYWLVYNWVRKNGLTAGQTVFYAVLQKIALAIEFFWSDYYI